MNFIALSQFHIVVASTTNLFPWSIINCIFAFVYILFRQFVVQQGLCNMHSQSTIWSIHKSSSWSAAVRWIVCFITHCEFFFLIAFRKKSRGFNSCECFGINNIQTCAFYLSQIPADIHSAYIHVLRIITHSQSNKSPNKKGTKEFTIVSTVSSSQAVIWM